MSITATSGASLNESVASTVKRELGKDEFLQLLVAQMRYQDPLEPMKNTEYIAQLAQFSSLEAIQALSDQMKAIGDWLGLSQSSSMIGKNIRAVDSATGQFIEGLVLAVNIKDGAPYLELEEAEVLASDVVKVF
ncbi:MAG: flagellar hook capping FlgD N-terminal domain-containing protein [Actinomycetota bacterium]|nr:flagellar hook capping FlgD N-terminal domain-containing protein [Actinomycetota bacterium]